MRRLGWWLLAACLGCGASVPRTRAALDEARLARAEGLEMQTRAPLLWANLQRAQDEAERAAEAEDPIAADEFMTEARLWLEAGIAECERADLAEQRLEGEREIEELDRVAIGAARALREVERRRELDKASAIAAEEARRALERAATLPSRRPKLDRAAVTAAVDALLTRARLAIAAARAMAAPDEVCERIERALDEARGLRSKDPDAALDAADRALFEALATLGAQREVAEAPAEGESSELADLLAQAGFRVVRGDTGLRAEIGSPFVRGRLSHGAQRKLARACALAKLHPSGPVRAHLQYPSRADKQEKEVARRLAAAGCEGTRFGVDVVAASPELSLVWLAY